MNCTAIISAPTHQEAKQRDAHLKAFRQIGALLEQYNLIR